MQNTKESAREFIENGGKCIYRYGFQFKGASAGEISKAEALKLLEKHSFGMGFWTMCWNNYRGETVLEFNELSENDLW